MGRRKSELPEVGKRMIRGAWSVYWWWGGKMFSVAVGVSGEEMKDVAESVRRALSSAVAAGTTFPAPYDASRAARRYTELRYGTPSEDAGGATEANAEEWLSAYAREIRAECAARWADFSLARLGELHAKSGLTLLTPEAASAYLSDIAARRKTGTRNRILAVFSRFYKWAVRTERAAVNPFAGIKTLKEEKSLDIVYCTPKERTEIIALAEATAREDWLAVPLAFYSGMRREEVALLEWPDVRFAEGILVVGRSKTKKGRTIPLNATLESLLLPFASAGRSGYVVKIPEGIDRLLRLDNLIRAIQKAKRQELLAEWDIPRPAPSRSKEYAAKKKEFEAAKKKRAGEMQVVLRRIGWNPFRHTFGSLLAQAGVSIDKISAWMGNTPEVCRRHYAQFIPRDRRDSEIDKL